MSFIDTDDEKDFVEEDIIKLYKNYKDYLDIDDIILRREKKERRKLYENTKLINIISDIEIGKKINEKYNLAITSNTPIEFIFEEDEKLYSIRDKLKDNEDILNMIYFFKENHNIELYQFIFAFYFSNIFKSDEWLITQLNKLFNLTDMLFKEDEWDDKKNKYNNLFEERMKITTTKQKKIFEFYKEINNLKFSNSPDEINKSLVLENTKIEIDVKINDYLFNIDGGHIIFNDLKVSEKFPYIQFDSYDQKYYKIYDKNINIENIINEKNNLFNNLDEDDDVTKENVIYIMMKLEILNNFKYIFLIFNLENSKLTFEFPFNMSYKIYDDLEKLILGINFKNEKITSITGSFEFKINNFDDLKLYYLTLFDKKIANFLYVNDKNRPRSLMKNIKYYYKSYEEKYLQSNYFLTFHLEQLYVDKYLVVFKSKTINQENNINEFSLVFSKLINFYENYDFNQSDLPIIVNPYTGIDGDGLGDNLDLSTINNLNFLIKGNKLANLKSIAPEIFPLNTYGRNCSCLSQPIIVDEEDITDWEEYKNKKEGISVFPPLDSSDKIRKRYNFVCPSKNSIMNYIINPDSESPFPILPCCSQKVKNNFYENYDLIKQNPEKFFSTLEEQKGSTKDKLKTFKSLSPNQEGIIPAQLIQFLKNIYPDNDFLRLGVIKNSKSSFFHCIMHASSHLKIFIKKVKNETYIRNLKLLNNIRNEYMGNDIIKKDEIINKIRTHIGAEEGIKINKEIMSQELYNYDKYQIINLLEEKNNIFDSKLFYKLLEYLFFVNIFVFNFNNGIINLEKPRHIYYHQREIRTELPSIFIFKQGNNYELIKSNDIFLFSSKSAEYMKSYVEDFGYYIANHNGNKYNVTKNYYSNINWNYILKDYSIDSQIINDTGRTFAININLISPSLIKDGEIKNKLTIFIPPSFPLDAPLSNNIYKGDIKKVEKLFGKNYIKGSEGIWYELNQCPKSIFVPINNFKENDKNICNEYIIINENSKQVIEFKKLNIIKKNANIISQIILWIWNISDEKDLNIWFDNHVREGDKKLINSINNNYLNIEYRFPKNIKTTLEAINYYSDYIPIIFTNNKIFLYEELKNNIYRFIQNFIIHSEGIDKNPNDAIVNLFNSEIDFTERRYNKLIIGEQNFDDWYNFVQNINSDTTNINDTYSDKKRGFIYKNNLGNIFIIQNNINNSLEVSLIICKVWKKLNINLGYYTTTINIWDSIRENNRLKEVLEINDEEIISLAKKYLSLLNDDIKEVEEALLFLKREKIEYELKETDHNYITINYDEYINKNNFTSNDPYNLFSYENGAYASMLNII